MTLNPAIPKMFAWVASESRSKRADDRVRLPYTAGAPMTHPSSRSRNAVARARTFFIQQYDIAILRALILEEPIEGGKLPRGSFLWCVRRKLELLADPKTPATIVMRIAAELEELGAIAASGHPEFVKDHGEGAAEDAVGAESAEVDDDGWEADLGSEAKEAEAAR